MSLLMLFMSLCKRLKMTLTMNQIIIVMKKIQLKFLKK